ncbi:MAG: bifunctional [glutamate--ammonia ligase]-adenylyl-L-tyrosine phosphorylase/[glutamate--ammonia-ligase] adenylyltransferase [Verrucomicrobiales bacterium]|nr:bifunctional [glutamate--ammonia ligase]-adenylyl-L-tyrosine phosphorylase/[glutamate--ammonia-ligase] adenylyltransferase [Verrucomicrobiales bacterium]
MTRPPLPLPWKAVVEASAAPVRAQRHLAALRDLEGDAGVDLAGFPEESARILTAVLAGSVRLSNLLRQHPDWLTDFADPERLKAPRRTEGLRRQMVAAVAPALKGGPRAIALDALHELRLRELLRIAARDLARLGTLREVVTELSNLADVYLEGLRRILWKEFTDRFGEPWHRSADGHWVRTPFCVLGMGKLGGQELNYSSDVDLLFVYGDEGGTYRAPPKAKTRGGPPNPALPNYQFFKRLAEALIKEGTSRGVEGGALRIDLRLRPEGDSGPLARSLDSYENFYAEWGQPWERMMLLKARCVAGDESLAGEFLEVIQSFRYPRSLGAGLLGEMAEMKERIEREVVRAGEIDRNVKLGRGGIREIEFVVQTLQVLHGGRNPFLQTHQTLQALPKLASYELLEAADAACLAEAYQFLRDVEHRLQMEDHRQTHTIPSSDEGMELIARLMGFENRSRFQAALQRHTQAVRRVYESVLGTPQSRTNTDPFPDDFDDQEHGWSEVLRQRGFRDPDKATRLCRVLVEGPGFGHVSRRTSELGRQLLQRLIDLCPGGDSAHGRLMLSDPDRVLARLDSYISAYGTRSSLYELWTARPNVFEHIVKLFDRSEFLAELAIAQPDLVDELEAGAHIQRQKDATQTLADLRHGVKDADQHLWLRRYFQTEFMRLGLRDILGLVEPDAANLELTGLAEACVQYALEVVARRHRLREPPFAAIALGKFGGAELVYGSDLDLIFVAPDSTKNLPRLQKMAREVLDLLSSRTPQGMVFEIDTRLRPDGEKGMLVNLLRAHATYYRQHAMLWEIQALTRARHVAGHGPTGKAFEQLARVLTDFRTAPPLLAAFAPDWRDQIARMRARIEKERTPAGKELLAFKTGRGGLVDAEFVAQTLAMQHGWFEPNTLKSLEIARGRGALAADDADTLLVPFRQLRRMESILRRWSFEGEAVLPDDPAPQYRVAVRCGFADAKTFLTAVSQWRDDVRKVYLKVFPPVT